MRRAFRTAMRSCLAACILVLATSLMAQNTVIVPQSGESDPNAQGPDRVSVLVYLEPGADRGPLRAFTQAYGGYVNYESGILPELINLRGMPVVALGGLQNVPGVVSVEEDGTAEASLVESTPLIRALQSQITAEGLFATGAGKRVCVVDSGMFPASAMYDANVDAAAWLDLVNGVGTPYDDNGHGSHMTGIICGEDGPTFNGAPFQGVAPEAKCVGVKALNAGGAGAFSDIVEAIDYCAGTHPTLAIPGGPVDVINLSLAAGLFPGTCDSETLAAAANAAVAAGAVVVAASGNDNDPNNLAQPACGSDVISARASYDENSLGWSFYSPDFQLICSDIPAIVDDPVCIANASPELDVVAPGCNIHSSDGANVFGVASVCASSPAAAQVSGLAALVLSGSAGLTPADVRQCIRDGAIDLGAAGPDSTFGYGRIDAINSLNACSDGSCLPSGSFCASNSQCCSNSCKGKPGEKKCKGGDTCSSTCGNGIIECSEACDGVDLGGTLCTDLGFTGGTLACAGDCTFDTSSCTGGGCAAEGDSCTTKGDCCPGLKCKGGAGGKSCLP